MMYVHHRPFAVLWMLMLIFLWLFITIFLIPLRLFIMFFLLRFCKLQSTESSLDFLHFGKIGAHFSFFLLYCYCCCSYDYCCCCFPISISFTLFYLLLYWIFLFVLYINKYICDKTSSSDPWRFRWLLLKGQWILFVFSTHFLWYFPQKTRFPFTIELKII